MAPTHDLFISYSRKNQRFVERLASDLQSHGIRVWLDTLEIEVGDRFRQRIEDGITGSRYFALVISSASMASYYVRQMELEAAFTHMAQQRRESFILPLMYKKPEGTLPPMLASRHYLNFNNPKAYLANMQKLVKKVRLGREDFTGSRLYKNIQISSYGQIAGIEPINQLPYVGDSIRVLYENGRAVKAETYSDARLTGYKVFDYDSEDRVVENSLYRGDQYIDTWRYEYDQKSKRRVKKLVYCRGYGPPFAEVLYNELNQQIEERVFAELCPPRYKYGFGRRTFAYNDTGELVKEVWYDEEGRVISEKSL